MKKNKWLLMLAAIVLLATCLFAGLAMADDAGEGTAVVTDTVWPETNKDKYTVTLNYAGDPRNPVVAPFINGVADNDRGYYAGEIYVEFGAAALPKDKTNKDTGDIQVIGLTLKYNNNQYVGTQYNGEDVYFTFESSNGRVIFPAGDKYVKATDLTGTKNNKLSLNLMTIDEMIGELYNENQVITNAAGTMIPGSAVITVTPYTSADGKTFKPIPFATPAQFAITVKPVTWTNVLYAPSYLVHKEGNDFVLYLQDLQDMVWWDQDTGFYFPIESTLYSDGTIGKGLGIFTIQPYTATYKKLHFDIDNTDVANITSDFKDIVIKQTGEFNLIVSDEDGYTTKAGKGPWVFHFTVKDAQLTAYPIQSVNFTYDQFTRKSGEYLDLNKYVYMVRLDQLGQHYTKGTLFKQNLKRGSSFEKDAKYAGQTYTKWAEDTLGWTWVDDRWEKFTVEWTSSNTKVAQIVNKDDIFIDTTVETNAGWNPDGSWAPWYEDTYTIGSPSGRRLAWYSKQDKKYIYPSQGYVRFGQAGTAIITVKVIDQGSGAFYTASTKITVKGDPAPADVLVKKIKLNFRHSPMTMYVGDKENILDDIEVRPSNATNKTLTITTSNKKIVKVGKDGSLTAKKPGTVTITVSATDGSGVSKSFKVEVLKK